MPETEAPRRAELSVKHLRILRLLEWDTPTDEIVDRMDMAPHEISGVAKKLRDRGFPLRKRTRHETCARRPMTKTSRPCLRCSQPFPSEGAHNRICVACKESYVWRDHGWRCVA